MPTYEYRCKNCGKEIEVVHKITDAPHQFIRHEIQGEARIKVGAAPPRLTRCSGEMTRLVSSKTSFVLKGAWAADGYSSDSKS